MNRDNRVALSVTSLLIGLVAMRAAAQEVNEDPVNRVSLSYRGGFNIKADFRNLGRAGVAGGPSVTGLSYENGFVRPNSEPNDAGLSWNWGYQSASQVVGDNIVMTSSQPGKVAAGQDDSPVNGLELSYNRRMGRWGQMGWGFEAAGNYASLDIQNRANPAGAVLTAHAFSLGGSTPPQAPYSGTPEGPGVLISETPTVATVEVRSRLETTVVGARLGPYVEWPLGKRVVVTGSGGFALAWADSDYRMQEAVAVEGAGSVLESGKGNRSEWLPGWYVGANVGVKLCRGWSVYAGAQFQDVGDHRVRVLDKEAKLDLSESIFLTGGISFSF